jgi:large subunit ribosomal protein L15
MPAWFEGGQTPLTQRLPKLRGFKRFYKLVKTYTVVNLGKLQED